MFEKVLTIGLTVIINNCLQIFHKISSNSKKKKHALQCSFSKDAGLSREDLRQGNFLWNFVKVRITFTVYLKRFFLPNRRSNHKSLLVTQ